MGRCLLAFALVCACACNAHLGGQDNHALGVDGATGSGAVDGGSGTMTDAEVMLGPWGTPAPVTGAASAGTNEDDPTLSSDGLELYYAVATAAGKDLYEMTRVARTDPFANATVLTAFNGGSSNEGPRLAYDDLAIYWGEDGEIYSATRATITSPWTGIAKVPGVDTAAYEKWLAVCGDGSHFVVSRDNGAATGQDLFEGTLGNGAGTRIDTVSSSASEISTFLSKDCLTLYFASSRVAGQTQIYMSTRTAIGSAWGTPTLAPAPFAAGTDNEDAGYTPDQRLFVFATTRGNGTKDVYLSTR